MAVTKDKEMQSRIISLYRKYDFFGLSDFSKIIRNILEDYSGEENLEEGFKNYLREILDNPDEQMILMRVFVSKKLSFPDDTETANNNLNTLINFFVSLDYLPSDELVTKIIDDLDVIKYSLQFLSNDKESILKDKINERFKTQYNNVHSYLDEENTDGIKSILDSIYKVSKPISKEEEKRLMTDYKCNGNRIARQELIIHNLRLVLFIARQYHFYNTQIPLEDLFFEGCFGLIKAVDDFDMQYDCRLATLAGWRIRNAIRDSLRLQKSTNIAFSLNDSVLVDGNNTTFENIIPDKFDLENTVYERIDKDVLWQNIANSKLLTEEEKRIVVLYYCEGMNMNLIGKLYNVSKQVIFNKLKSALNKLRNGNVSKKVKESPSTIFNREYDKVAKLDFPKEKWQYIDRSNCLDETAEMILILKYQDHMSASEIGKVLELPPKEIMTIVMDSVNKVNSGYEMYLTRIKHETD